MMMECRVCPASTTANTQLPSVYVGSGRARGLANKMRSVQGFSSSWFFSDLIKMKAGGKRM